MKALVDNLAIGATITSLYETLSYPASNVADTFLNRPFISALDEDTLTVDLGADTSVDTVFIAGCNATSAIVTIQNAALATVYTDTIAIGETVVAIYTGAVTGRYLNIEATTTATNLRINGVGIGVAFDFGRRNFQPSLPVVNSTSRVRSSTGQVMANRAPTLRQRTIEIPLDKKDGGLAQFDLINEALVSVGIGNPIYWDLNDDNSDFEVPIYGEMPDAWNPTFDKYNYAITFTILEAR